VVLPMPSPSPTQFVPVQRATLFTLMPPELVKEPPAKQCLAAHGQRDNGVGQV